MELKRFIVAPAAAFVGVVACTSGSGVEGRSGSRSSASHEAPQPETGSGGQAPLSCRPNGDGDVIDQPPTIVSGVLQTDPAHKGHLGPRTAFPECGVPYVAPSTVADATLDFHYKTHRFKNWNASAACVVVDVTYFQCGGSTFPCPPEITCEGDVASGICGGVGFAESAVYRGSFDSDDIRANLLAQSDYDAGPHRRDHLAFTVAPNEEFVVVLRTPQRGDTVGTGLGYDPYYNLYVSGCGAPQAGGGGGEQDAGGGGGDDNDAGGGGKTW